MKFYATLMVTVVVVILLAEVSPSAVNALLILILLGIVLGRYGAFQELIGGIVGSVGETVK